MRIVVDLQACQAEGYYQRGIGNYSLGLVKGMQELSPAGSVFTLGSGALPYELDDSVIRADRHIRLNADLPWSAAGDFEGGSLDSIGAIHYATQCQALQPDVIHVSHNFLDCKDRVMVPGATNGIPGQLVTTTLYDLIPLRFADHYLRADISKRRYHYQLERLRRYDLLFAISESTRADAIELLNIEPWRVVTIHGGVEGFYGVPDSRSSMLEQLHQRFQLNEKILLYTGGDDFRKNIDGLIQGFASIDAQLRDRTVLVIAGKLSDGSKQNYRNLVKSLKIPDQHVLFTGFISEADLSAFYGCCDAFIFPSKYEGLGLPVIEAMKCGAPVIGSDNSSIRELIKRDDALFDADNHQAMARVIERALSDDQFAQELREHALREGRNYSWQKSAGMALAAMDEALKQQRQAGVSAAVSGWLPRKHLALLTPLPPCQSGIAEYATDFLPYLSRHFDIDIYLDGYAPNKAEISAVFRMFDISDFEANAENYDAILYEIGNSDFHSYMLPYLYRYPGVVTLHDAYMSGILAHHEFSLNQRNSYQHELLYSHGPRGRRYIAPNTDDREAIAEAIDTLPTTKRILDRALGVISHSSFNIDVANQHFPEGWLAPYRIVPQIMACRKRDPRRTAEYRNQLKLPEDAFVICTFGHVVWTKCGDLLLQAFCDSEILKKANAHLVFVGKLAEDEFGTRLKNSIKKLGSKRNIHITGFVDTAQYEGYLQSADVAVQLRQSSRGGTPRSVLDCLANELPVVINDYASFQDYPDQAVLKVAAEVTVAEVREKLEQLFENPEMRSNFADQGMHYVQSQHDPVQCAAAYAASIDEFTKRAEANSKHYYRRALAPHIDPSEMAQLSDSLPFNTGERKFQRRKLFVDVSHIAQTDHQSGIQRIVRDLVREFYFLQQPGIEPVAVELVDKRLVVAKNWLVSQDLLSSCEQDHLRATEVEFSAGDVLLMLDSSWDRYSDFYSVFERARNKHVPIVGVIYDLLPIRIPECFVEGGPKWFETWLKKAIDQSDALISISAATETDLGNYIQKSHIENPPLLGHWHHGCDFAPNSEEESTQRIKAIRAHNLEPNRYLLMVGTIEPRKLHDVAVAAMRRLWEKDVNLKLCIAGKQGWLVEEFMDDLRDNSGKQENLIFIEAPTDPELSRLYESAAGLLFLSKGEGFGLPLIEAASYGIPILCSDIPSFREVAQGHATFTAARNGEELADDIHSWFELKTTGKLPDSSSMKVNSCEESASAIVHTLFTELNL
ncbi:MAG: glycosyltransferase [Pseudomonadota bacterium]